jgi:formate hydrogenlyase subunit 3/multisubunit Na+/H+ antiporter MnhD subunit
MSAPLLFVGLPLIAAPVLYALRRARFAGIRVRVDVVLATALCLVLLLLALSLPLGQPVRWLGGIVFDGRLTVLGRAFQIDSGDRPAMALIFVQAALLSAASALVRPGRYYLPAGTAILGLLTAALLVQPFLFAALFIELGAALAVFMLGDEGQPETRGALRFLVTMTLGMPFILLTGWLLEASAVSPEDLSFVLTATALLAAGFAVWLAVVPFHSWLPVVAEHAPPLAAAFVFSVLPTAIAFLLLDFLNVYPWLGQNPTVYRGLTLAGGAMALVGAVFAFGQRNFGRSVGYAMMIDIGGLVLGIGLGTRAGMQSALATLAMRALALLVWAIGLSTLRQAARGDDFDSLRSLGRRYPVASAAVVLGLLSLAGIPVTAGFTARWALLRLLMQIHPTPAIFLLIGMASLSLVCARGLSALLTPHGEVSYAPQESRVEMAVCGLGLIVILVLGAFPQLLLPTLAQAASVFTGIGP